MSGGLYQEAEDPGETRKWEKQKQDEAQRSKDEDKKEAKDWEDGNRGNDKKSR
jgi:hypothetical protein